MRLLIDFATHTLKGKRDYNQDSFLARQVTSDIHLFAVADGMGGTFGGEMASKTAIETLDATINQNLDKIYDLEDGISWVLKLAITNIQQALAHRIDEDKKYSGMGTTLAAMLIYNSHYAWCNIGDSRIYSFTQGNLYQLTEDHSYIQELMGKDSPAELTEDFLNKHDNIITRVLNGGDDEADFFISSPDSLEVNPQQRFVICSDGLVLNKRQKPKYLQEILMDEALKPHEACEKLSCYAYENGSTDNITSVVIFVEPGPIASQDMKAETLKINTSDDDNP